MTQGAKSLETLEKVKDFFGCGKIYENKRYDNHREVLCRYCVRNKNDLIQKICPFFDKYKLETAKRNDFELFKQGLEIIEKGEHLTEEGFKRIQDNSSKMNRRKPRNIESPTTKRQNLEIDKIESELYGDVEVTEVTITTY